MTDTRPISPSYLDLQTLRVSTVLPAAGAFDTAPLEVSCQEYDFMTLYLAYTRGDAAGAFKMKILVSPDTSGDTWYQTTVYDAGAVAGGSDTTSAFQREELQYGATAAAIEKFVFHVTLDAGVQRIRIPCAESGAVGKPGTLEIRAMFS